MSAIPKPLISPVIRNKSTPHSLNKNTNSLLNRDDYPDRINVNNDTISSIKGSSTGNHKEDTNSESESERNKTSYGPIRNQREFNHSKENNKDDFFEVEKPKTKFRLQRQLISLVVWNLTYQGREITKELVHNNILKYYNNNQLEWFIVAKEIGSRSEREHLHVLIHYGKKIDTKDFKYFNRITTQQGFRENLQVHICESRNIKQSVEYVTKGGDFLTFGDVPVGRLKQEKPLEIICQSIISKSESLAQLRIKYPSTFVIHGKKIQDFYNTYMEDKMELSMKQWDIRCIDQRGLNEYELKVLGWIYENFPPIAYKNNIRAQRRHKQKQLYIFGPRDSYKTSLCLALNVYFNGLPIQEEETFYDHLARDQYKYGYLYFEEFSGNKTISHLNQFIEGQYMNLRAKGSQFFKMINYPVIFLSNSSLRECYQKASELHPLRYEALESRLEMVELYLGEYNRLSDKEVRKYTLKTLTERISSIVIGKQYEDLNKFMNKVKLNQELRSKLIQTDARMKQFTSELGYSNDIDSEDDEVEIIAEYNLKRRERKNESSEEEEEEQEQVFSEGGNNQSEEEEEEEEEDNDTELLDLIDTIENDNKSTSSRKIDDMSVLNQIGISNRSYYGSSDNNLVKSTCKNSNNSIEPVKSLSITFEDLSSSEEEF